MNACPINNLIGGGNNSSVAVSDCPDCIPADLVKVFPNPASTTIQVKWLGDGISAGTVQLIDLLGRVLMEQELQGENQFQVSAVPPGQYMVRVKVDGYKQQVKRVVVDR